MKLPQLPKWFLFTILIIIVIRIALPFAGKYAVNWYLRDHIFPYTGHIADFDLALYRGAYQFDNLSIEKRKLSNGKELKPLLSIKKVDVSLAWRALFRRKILADLVIYGAHINVLDSRSKNNTQNGTEGTNWKDALTTLIPIDVESLKISDSEIIFENIDFKKPKDIKLSQIDLTASNINNSERTNSPVFSKLDFKGKLQGQTDIKITGLFDILSKIPEFDLSFQMKDFDMSSVNDLLLAYIPLSFTQGRLSIYSELATLNSKADGYIKVFMKNVDVIKHDEVFKSVKHFFIEAITAIGNLFLRNSKEHEVAFRVPIKGPITDLKVSGWDAFKSALSNAFDKNPPPEGLENSISLKNVK